MWEGWSQVGWGRDGQARALRWRAGGRRFWKRKEETMPRVVEKHDEKTLTRRIPFFPAPHTPAAAG